jgi:hypothetical protein
MVDRVADLLAPTFPHGTSKDELRSEAFGWLARPAELLQLLLDGVPDPDFDQANLAEALREIDPAKLRPRVVLYVHLSQAAIASINGRRGGCVECGYAPVARVEDIGPLLASEVPEWLGHAYVTVKPVINLDDLQTFDAYEHPIDLADRVHLRSPADGFPYGTQVSSHLDIDHIERFLSGVPGQTGDHNSQPLSRTGHRIKTFTGFAARQLRPGVCVWRTPHSQYYLVSPQGTEELDEHIGSGLMSDDPIDRAIAQMTLDLQHTGRAHIPEHLRGTHR